MVSAWHIHDDAFIGYVRLVLVYALNSIEQDHFASFHDNSLIFFSTISGSVFQPYFLPTVSVLDPAEYQL